MNSIKGKYVVDYICVPIDVLRMITKFNVATLYTIVEEFKLHYKFIGEKSKLPDHSAITCDFNISDCCNVSDAIRTKHRKNRFQLHRIPSDFMQDFMTLRRSALIATVDLIENSRKSQECIDEIYEKECDIISNEMRFQKSIIKTKITV